MLRLRCTAFILIFLQSLAQSQFDDTISTGAFKGSDTLRVSRLLRTSEIEDFLESVPGDPDQIVLGGYLTSVYRVAIDSVRIQAKVDGRPLATTFSDKGLFYIILEKGGTLIDIKLSHPDYHTIDTSLVIQERERTLLRFELFPKYKILLRGRVYAGNMPLEGVDVTIRHLDNEYNLVTRGCFYDREDYWNCLYDGMFKAELTAETPEDSIWIILSKVGLKTFTYGMKFNQYSGEILRIKMQYKASLPNMPSNDLNLKLSFPILSLEDDWYVGFSYYRHVRNIRRLAYGIDANMYITNTSQQLETFPGLPQSSADSSYIDAFLGPSLLFYFVKPEKRFFSSYAGTTFSMQLADLSLVPQFFVGSRIFLDLNKALSLEIRYTEFESDIVEYSFNPFGNADRNTLTEKFRKIHATLGVQVVF